MLACDQIRAERIRQDAKWGVLSGRSWQARPTLGLTVLAEKVGEVAKAILEGADARALRSELVQVAAVCVKWLEALA